MTKTCPKAALIILFALAWNCSPAGPSPANAMEFKVANTENGQTVLIGTGDIVPGDAERLRAGLDSVRRDRWGLKELALSSSGGLVDEAFRMGDVIDAEGVLIFIPANASCASACAVILFIDGKYHIVIEGGALGIHTCYHGASKMAAPECNDRIAQNAVAHGTDYGSVEAPMEYTPAAEIIWFGSKEADCWGLSKWPPGAKTLPAIPPCVRAVIEGKPIPLLKPAPVPTGQ